MGHQSTESIGRYGNKRSGTGACSITTDVENKKLVESTREPASTNYLAKKLDNEYEPDNKTPFAGLE